MPLLPRRTPRVPAVLVAFVLVAFATACGSGAADAPVTGPVPAPAPASVTVISGGNLRDTALARHTAPLVLEFHDVAGAPAQGLVVQLTPRPPDDTTRRGDVALYVCGAGVTGCGPGSGAAPLVDTTDAAGRVTATVRFGTVAGPAALRVAAPALGVRDSVPFLIDPGAPHDVRMTVHDVTVPVGVQRTITGVVVDAWGNSRPDLPTYTLTNPDGAAALDAATATVTSQDIGTAWVVAHGGGGRDSTGVHVVPTGRLVVWNAVPKSLLLMNLDGSAARVVASNVNSADGTFPRFGPAGDEFVLHVAATAGTGGAPTRVLVLDTTAGTVRHSWTAPDVLQAGGLLVLGYARELADGTTLAIGHAVAGLDAIGAPVPGAFALFQLTPAGTIVARAPLPHASAMASGAFDIAPDGSRVAYVTADPATGASTGLVVVDVASGRQTLVDAQGAAPRWAPAGDRLAYLVPTRRTDLSFEPRLAVAAPDGSGRVLIGVGAYLPGLAWSPDGAYVLGALANGDGLQVARTRDGREVTLRLPGTVFPTQTATYLQPDWR